MAYRFFRIEAHGQGDEVRELNAFLSSHRIVAVERIWHDGSWAFCCEYLERGGGSHTTAAPAIDYKDVFNEVDFAVFAALRSLRKELAEAEGRPVFAVFTNEQLAEMVRRRCRSIADLSKIPGVGSGRVDRYGAKFLEVLAISSAESSDASKP